MNSDTTRPTNELPESRQHDLETLSDLQSYLVDVLASDEGTNLKHSFKPLTDGLGLESPKSEVTRREAAATPPPKKEVPVAAKEVKAPAPAPEIKKPRVENSFAAVMEAPIPEEGEQEAASSSRSTTTPPALPKPSIIKRLCAVFLDQLFVMTLWLMALVATSNLMNGFTTGLSIKVFEDFTQSAFVRFAALEFAAIWLGYLSICLGILDMTFGMWVWGIRVSYGNRGEENYGLRKIMRIFWSFVFYAPLVPLITLAIRKNGRNLLDLLSGSNVYVSQQD